ncbi:MAG: adenine phosphoribosyltransferase [Gammaproteobacteria bacterium]|nr:adenine phosphoribosyltransferase [Gammaproteobacteria bacterium]
MQRIVEKIRTVYDFPKPGIVFRDITPLLMDTRALRLAVHHLIHPFADEHLTAVAAMEARGFVFGALAAAQLGVGFVPLRKPGKLPHETERAAYDLEYGSAALEIHADALSEGDRVLIVDDLIATGGTAAASCQLVERLGATVIGLAFVIELEAFEGRQRLAGHAVHTVITY